MPLGTQLGSLGRDRGSWLALLCILVGVLVPTAGVLWFMNEAMKSQRDAARERLTAAYRAQLALVSDRLSSSWEKRAAQLDQRALAGPAPAAFESIVREQLADAVVIFDRSGQLAYPAPEPTPQAEPIEHRDRWQNARALEGTAGKLPQAAEAYAGIARESSDVSEAARAVQAQIRCLMRTGDAQAALRVIDRQFGRGRLARTGMDLEGRLVAADEQLLAVHLNQSAGRAAALRRLAATLADYTLPMPSAQRLFLMDEARAVDSSIPLPTYDAERLAARFLADPASVAAARGADTVLRRSALPDVWQRIAPGGRVIALYQTARLTAEFASVLNSPAPSADVVFGIAPPGSPVRDADESTPAGALLPGWSASLRLHRPLDVAAGGPAVSYAWVGFLVIATMVALGGIAGQAIQRQMRLARLKTDLVAAVSHEIKTPLSSMRLLVDALLEDGEPDAGKTREYLELIARENVRLSRLIDNFLTFSRMERNRQRFEFLETQPARVVEAAVEAAGERFHAPGCRFDVELIPGLPALRADQDALVAVLLNLLDNAYKFSPDVKHIRLRAFPEPGRVCFAVADNGIGIPPRERKRIFRRFYQVDRRLARSTGGCGLGLSIVDFIVRAHGGEITVDSQPGVGSTFMVALPCASAGAMA